MDVHLCQIIENQSDASSASVSAVAGLTQMNPDSDVNKPFLLLVKEEMLEALNMTHFAEVKSV